jgi:MoaA/NifB/PqqE/SkfB family radical SAM enzyme
MSDRIRIKHLLFEVSNKCNFNCRYCYFHDSGKITSLSTGKIKGIISALKAKYEVHSIGFTGGEPLIRKDIFEILQHCYKLKIKTSLGTNGSLIRAEDIPKYKKLINTITVNLDGDEDYFNWVTRTSSYSLVIKNINILKRNKINFGIHCNVTPGNLTTLPKLIRLYRDMGARFIQVGDIQSTQSESNHELKKLQLNNAELYNLYKIIKLFERSKRTKTYLRYNLIDGSGTGCIDGETPEFKKYFNPFFTISQEGILYPMVDVKKRWSVCDDITSEDIDIKRLERYIKLIPIFIKNAIKLLESQSVVSPYLVIKNTLESNEVHT